VTNNGLQLQCPECTKLIRVPRRKLVEGAAVQCTHCDAEAELAHEFEDASGKSRWILIDPDAEHDNDGE
jgi:hypothetical protein